MITKMIKVKNRNSGGQYEGYWINYWKHYSNGKKIPSKCPCCDETMESKGGAVGGHVVKCVEPRGDIYITPICRSCNSTYKNSKAGDKEFFVAEDMLVHANVNKIEKEFKEILDEMNISMLVAGVNKEELIEFVIKDNNPYKKIK